MRRRKARYTWLPVLGSTFGSGEVTNDVNMFFEELVVPLDDAARPAIDSNSMFCIPVVPDFTLESSARNASATLRDQVEGNDWLLKRLVGKIFVSQRTGDDASTSGWPAVIVTCGFFVARAIDADQAACELQDDDINVQGLDNVANPWIWRRSWKLGNFDTAHSGGAGAWPSTNSGYGSVMDGPHLDSKVSRRIRREERLWWTASAFGVSPLGLTVEGATNVDIQMDLRVLGALRKQRNKSSF